MMLAFSAILYWSSFLRSLAFLVSASSSSFSFYWRFMLVYTLISISLGSFSSGLSSCFAFFLSSWSLACFSSSLFSAASLFGTFMPSVVKNLLDANGVYVLNGKRLGVAVTVTGARVRKSGARNLENIIFYFMVCIIPVSYTHLTLPTTPYV
eukprot:TRINITY_DN734_c0_g1_i7.p1 TRINITY_DN734_c0_g1~~TRINITY_DN734_c0_g1_i7.p1  ORF type:complete len:152 (-),score=7.07 TRINITY_DN734_c0_g1_i7:45-500(-)